MRRITTHSCLDAPILSHSFDGVTRAGVGSDKMDPTNEVVELRLQNHGKKARAQGAHRLFLYGKAGNTPYYRHFIVVGHSPKTQMGSQNIFANPKPVET